MDAPEIIDSMLLEAARAGASDIYFLPDPGGVEVRVRSGGGQSHFKRIDGELAPLCMSRLKVVSGMLTYKTRIAQDGAARLPGFEFRVAVMPTTKGERATVRVLSGAGAAPRLASLGYQPEALESLRSMLRRPDGLVVITGPTGCGKTTTMYAMVAELLDWRQDPASIISIEDPVERDMPDISQCSVTRSGESWGYCEALKAALRQDVKTLVIGEMRDGEVVRTALDAALSGHRVISTYHAGDVGGVYARMLLGGFEPFLVASAIVGVVAQRLLLKADGFGRIPAAATLAPDGAWTDFISGNPSLAAIRERVSKTPQADVKTVIKGMASRGLVSRKDPNLL